MARQRRQHRTKLGRGFLETTVYLKTAGQKWTWSHTQASSSWEPGHRVGGIVVPRLLPALLWGDWPRQKAPRGGCVAATLCSASIPASAATPSAH